MRKLIGIATTARSDFGCLLPLIRAIRDDPSFELLLYVTGTHFSPINNYSYQEVKNEFSSYCELIRCNFKGDGPSDITSAMAEITNKFGKVFSKKKPDILIVLGDRFDMISLVLAAVPFNIPIAHLSGGEVTEGVIDDVIRHATSKMAHLHFTSHEEYSRRLCQIGEEPWRVHTTGEPSIDYINSMDKTSKQDTFNEFGFATDMPLTLFTFHPETLNYQETSKTIDAVLRSADQINTQILFTHPNSDPGSKTILTAINQFAAERKNCAVVSSLGRKKFFAFSTHASCICGNSSSGIVEAASFKLPVVNIGIRQKGRLSGRNVLHVACNSDEIISAWKTALTPEFKQSLDNLINPYGTGQAVYKMIKILKQTPLDDRLLSKRFIDYHDPS